MQIELVEPPSHECIALLKHRFTQYIESQLPGLPGEDQDKIFMFTIHDNKQNYIGGILANCYWDGLEIDTLWIAPQQRGQGLGAKLVARAEEHALNLGAGIAFLKTVDAKLFYEKIGYKVYGVLEDRPIGTHLYHMKKQLHWEKE